MMDVLKTLSKTNSQKEIILGLISSHVDKGESFALWKVPSSQERHLILSNSKLTRILDEPLEELDPGFMIAPFHRNGSSYHIKADSHFILDGNKISHLSPTDNRLLDEKEFSASISGKLKIHKNDFKSNSIPKNRFVELVEKSIKAIAENTFDKVVPSRCILMDHLKNDPLQVFDNLCSQHPNAMVSMVSSPETGTWIGASPELLVSIDENQIFKTVSLAGTQLLKEGMNLRSVAWTQKEIEEQAFVSRYIINCFKQIRLREFTEHGPKTVQAGNLLHLKTEFEVDMKATNFPQLGSIMIKLLHPTSAVCGMPHEEASNFLAKNENYDREYYSGFLGPVNIRNCSQLYVNLRCMQWTHQGVILYAGAGVTIDSLPEQEWAETELKIQSLLSSVTL